ncbi:DNA internalization-related competence protein ComEC/Rec2 [Peribacillus cavernae]|uniref:DNA internalization-related competence protein ComEC/Rec2 n=1 Tax=Peribacillus cavernae TaxID=1674310 RepID=A0A3S0UIW1_9BACI|nr:DNA internalization-related competence protein ComEC/Rec2 [Peribacillus cavernae]MDQ0218237.1 competence protein ComEC [Peribacillus cavernae]RUQ32629.1 DNA internalization-related competence protein ComEC/Rec2 [Peribacillus cavernae]
MINLLFLAVSATFGVTAYSFFGWKVTICIALFLAFVLYKAGYRQVILQISAIALFFAAAYLADYLRHTSYTGSETSFRISLADIPDIDGNLLRASVHSDSGEKLQFRYTISTAEEKRLLEKKAEVGLSCPVKGTLEKAEPNRNINSFNYQEYLRQQGTYWILYAGTFSLKNCTFEKGDILQSIKRIRGKGIDYVETHFPVDTKGFVSALLFGEQKEINEEELSDFQRLGLVHLLAISGLHVSFLAGMVFYSGIRLGVTRERMNLALLILLPIYVILSGASPSVWRACLMAMLFFLLSLAKKNLSITKSIIIVYISLLFIQPYMLFDIGFQLSFAAAFSMIMSSAIFSRSESKILQLFMISFICQLSTLPILTFHFYEISVLGVLLNIVFVPLYSFLLPFSIAAFIIHIVYPPAGDFFIYFLNMVFTLSNEAAGLAARLPLASIAFGKPTFIIMLLLVGSLLLFFIFWDLSSFKTAKYYLAALALIMSFQLHIEKMSPYGEVVFIDIGQGDAILIKLPFDRGNYLIDTGGRLLFKQESWKKRRKSFTTGKDIIVPLLKSKGVDRLDKLILTHPDADHIGSTGEIIEEITVKEMIIGRGTEQEYVEKGVIEKARAAGLKITTVQRGDQWKMGDAAFYILHPYREEENPNESSVIIYAVFGGQRWLFTGDLGVEGEEQILKVFPHLRADVLKAGHHGSKTSTSDMLLDHLKPRTAIISAGKRNRYGHPHAEVVEALQRRRITIYRTDINGGILYRFSDDGGTFSSVLP